MSALLYQTLGISETATDDEVRKAYKKLSMKHHPDRNGGSKESEAQYKVIKMAYEEICNLRETSSHIPEDTQETQGSPRFSSEDLAQQEKTIKEFFYEILPETGLSQKFFMDDYIDRFGFTTPPKGAVSVSLKDASRNNLTINIAVIDINRWMSAVQEDMKAGRDIIKGRDVNSSGQRRHPGHGSESRRSSSEFQSRFSPEMRKGLSWFPGMKWAMDNHDRDMKAQYDRERGVKSVQRPTGGRRSSGGGLAGWIIIFAIVYFVTDKTPIDLIQMALAAIN